MMVRKVRKNRKHPQQSNNQSGTMPNAEDFDPDGKNAMDED